MSAAPGAAGFDSAELVMVDPKRISMLPIDLPPKALQAYNAANQARMRRSSTVTASATTPSTPALPIQSVADQSATGSQRNAEPVDPKEEWFSKLSPSEQRRELRRLIGLSKLGLDDDRVAQIFKEARAPYRR
jgi:hypothetical protein